MMRTLLTLVAGLMAACTVSRAQVDLEAEFFSLPDTVSNAYLDSLSIQVVRPNDYWMVGVYGGISLQYGFFNPTRNTQWLPQMPMYGFSVVRYYTMFGRFANMGMEFGAQMNYEGYEFKVNKETGYRPTESGAYQVRMQVPEAFFLSHFHFDIGEYFKLMAKVGLYGGYRLNINRLLDDYYAEDTKYQQYEHAFRDYDKRWTYGVQGGVGMALMFNPFEFHLTAQIKWGWESFWKPDYASPYYYRFGYPLDAAVTFGVYYQLTPRYGHTNAQLKKLARQMVEQQQNE